MLDIVVFLPFVIYQNSVTQSYACENTLRQTFEKYGSVDSVNIIFDKFKLEKSKSILACITINDDKVSIVVGLTHDLIDLYDARTLIKSTFDILGSKGGGGRVDFAQAGGNKKDQVNQAFLSIKNQI